MQLVGITQGGRAADATTDVSVLVAEIGRLVARTLEGDISVRLEIEPGLHICGHGLEMQQALLTLCISACDAMVRDGVLTLKARRLGADDPRRQHDGVPSGALVEICVEDTGLHREARGLGMSIVRGIIARRRGHVDVQSLPDRGTAISAVFPCEEARASRAPAGPPESPDVGEPRLQILVVEDDDNLRRGVARMLQHLGHRVLAAADGVEAVDLLRRHVGEVDIVLLDVNMPRLGGIAALEALRAVSPGVKVLLSTGAPDADLDPALRARANGLLPKPFNFQQLIEALKSGAMRPAGVSAGSEYLLRLDRVAAPLALCDGSGRVLARTSEARELLVGCGADESHLPEALWRELSAAPYGEAVTWRPEGTLCIGCTRYAIGATQMLVIMREVSGKQRELSRRMHQQRLEATGSLVAAVAHDIRGGLATVIFNTDVLVTRGAEMDQATLRTFLGEIMGGAERLKEIVDGLVDFARLRDQVQPVIALGPVLQRCVSVLRPKLRDRAADLTITHAQPDPQVHGNPLIIEQIVQNLLQNALEAGAQHICVHSELVSGDRVRVRVHDDGPGIPPVLYERIFEPFFTTRDGCLGLGLATSREAARHIGGDLLIDPAEYGASLSLFLRAGGDDR